MNRKGGVLSTKQIVRKKKILRLRIILLTVFIFSILYGLSHWSKKESALVSNIIVSGNDFVKEEEVKLAVTEELNGSYLFLFPKNNKFLIPRQKIKERLYTDFSAIEKVSLSVDDGSLSIEIVEFKPTALWCGSVFDNEEDEVAPPVALKEEVELEIVGGGEINEDLSIPASFDFSRRSNHLKDDCYFVNEFGIVFSVEPELHEYTLIRLHNVIEEGPIGSVYVDKDFFERIKSFENLLKEKLSINIGDVYTEDSSTYQFVMKEGPSLIVDSSDDFVKVADNLATVMALDSINTAQFKNIEYIDLRFGNRVFYKLR